MEIFHRYAPTGMIAFVQGFQHGGVRMHAGGDIGNGNPDLRAHLALTGDVNQAAFALYQVVIGFHGRIIALLAITGDVHGDQARISGAQTFGIQPYFFQGAGSQVLHEHIGLVRDAQKQGAVGLVFDIQLHRLLAAVDPHKVGSQPFDGLIVLTGEVAGIAFHFNNAGPGIGQPAGCIRRRDRLLDGDHGDAAQGFEGFTHG